MTLTSRNSPASEAFVVSLSGVPARFSHLRAGVGMSTESMARGGRSVSYREKALRPFLVAADLAAGDWNAFRSQPVTTLAIRSTERGPNMTATEFKTELARLIERA